MDRPRLDSWKEIARYLGRDIRTVIRWEQSRGLPIRRVPGAGALRVFAYREELDLWLNQPNGHSAVEESPVPPAIEPQLGRMRTRLAWVLASIATVAGLSLVWGWSLGPRPIHQVVIAHDALVAEDGAGRTLWTARFTPDEITPGSDHWHRIARLRDDDSLNVLALIQKRRPASDEPRGGALVNLSAGGRQEWIFSADDYLTFRAGQFGPPWSAADFDVMGAGPRARIAVALHHFTWWPALLVTLDANGQRLATFVSSGWIQRVVGSRDGRYIFISGVTNSRQAYFLAVLDAAQPSGRAPEPPGAPTECTNCPSGDPLHYFVFPRSDVGQLEPFPQNGPTMQSFDDGRIQVQTLESQSPKVASVIFDCTPAFTLSTVTLSDAFREWHSRFERESKLAHAAAACPSATAAQIQSWSPQAGWRTMRAASR